MNEVSKKYLVIDVDGEAVTLFPIVSRSDGARFEMIEAALASNPVLRLVDNAEVGQVWNGTEYTTPA
jgi:hypothetical protein